MNDRRYHYVYGDVRKREGSFDGEGDGDDEARDGDEDARPRGTDGQLRRRRD